MKNIVNTENFGINGSQFRSVLFYNYNVAHNVVPAWRKIEKSYAFFID